MGLNVVSECGLQKILATYGSPPGIKGKKKNNKKWVGAFQELEHLPERALHFLNALPKTWVEK